MILETIEAFRGEHCETTATGTLLRHIGVDLSEPMLFGLGEGLGYIFWNAKASPFPFIGGRVKPDVLTQNICRHLGLRLSVRETTSAKKAWGHVAEVLARREPVGLKLDCYHLEYFGTRQHFAGHYVAMYGFDEKDAYLVDTQQQGGRVKTSLASLARARAERGAMSSRNLSYTIAGTMSAVDLGELIRRAVHANAAAYLNPPIRNISYKGIIKTSHELRPWFERSEDVAGDDDGFRLLICRYRPRALKKEDETWDAWWSFLGPSRKLHADFYGKHAPPIGMDEYRGRYLQEMQAQTEHIIELARRSASGETITLLCSSACRDETHCHRTQLKRLIDAKAG